MERFEGKIYILCIGDDGSIHRCEPHLKECFCGASIQHKKVTNKDFEKRTWCFPCDVVYDDEVEDE
mgnify:CR=1 FL=1|jgi:hypothetical protein